MAENVTPPESGEPANTPATPPRNMLGLLISLVLIIVGALILGRIVADRFDLPGLWAYIALLMIIFLGIVGRETNGRMEGSLIDWRNKMSLTRLQIVMWTVLVMSAYMAIALPRVLPGGLKDMTDAEVDACLAEHQDEVTIAEDASDDERREEAEKHCTGDPLKIVFPEEIILAMGISIATFAGSGLIKDMQSKRTSLTSLDADYKKTVAEHEAAIAEKKQALADAQKLMNAATTDLTTATSDKTKLQGKVDEAQKRLDEAEAEGDEATINDAKAALDRAQKEVKANQPAFDAAKDRFAEADTAKATAEAELKAAQDELAAYEAEYQQERARARGQLSTNDKPDQATWGDMFRMEQAGESDKVDLSKVQMFFFTLVVLVTYGVALYTLLDDELVVRAYHGVDLPAVTASLNALLAISHGGYLAVKGGNIEQSSNSGK